MILFTLLTRDPVSLVSAASSVARAWEEYNVDEVVIIHTPGVRLESVEKLVDWISRLVAKESITAVSVDSTPEALTGRTYDVLAARMLRIIEEMCGDGRGILLVSSGSRRLASAAVLAALRSSKCKLDIAHVHFYFGPWSGLPYPYTPLRLHPLILMHGEGPEIAVSRKASERMLEAMNEATSKSVLGRLPPLRSVVAELARRFNMAGRTGFMLPSDSEHRCGTLVIETRRQTLPGADLCDPKSLANLAGKLAAYLIELEHDLGREGRELRSVLAWTGLAHLMVEDNEPLPALMLAEKTVIDSSIVYYGAHRYFWEGAEIYIPECLIREIHLNLAESVKGKKPRKKAIADIVAYLGLRDMLESGAPVLPTAPGHCDTSIPKMDPLILEGKTLVTSDSGAIRYWRSHPTRKIVKEIRKVMFEPEAAYHQKVDPQRDPASLPRLFYSIYQTLIVSELMVKLRLINEEDGLKPYVDTDGERRKVKIPVRTLLKALGYHQ